MTIINNMVNVIRVFIYSFICFYTLLASVHATHSAHQLDVLDKVKEIGIDYSQGYFLGKPENTLSN